MNSVCDWSSVRRALLFRWYEFWVSDIGDELVEWNICSKLLLQWQQYFIWNILLINYNMFYSYISQEPKSLTFNLTSTAHRSINLLNSQNLYFITINKCHKLPFHIWINEIKMQQTYANIFINRPHLSQITVIKTFATFSDILVDISLIFSNHKEIVNKSIHPFPTSLCVLLLLGSHSFVPLQHRRGIHSC